MAAEIEKLLAELTLEEKVSLLSGANLWETPAIERLDIPPLRVTDGPNGARGTRFTDGLRAACFPCGSALAATWDPELIEQVGGALAQEARSKGAHVLLGPTINIHRSPLAGRNFECYSEDPLLSARIAVAFVRGLQAGGVAACIKHFACNDSEYQRHSISSQVGERALREIYLAPFEAAVREAGAWSVMAAYNKVNGTYASEHPRLLDEILRGEWGFEGFVVSDWGGTQSTVEALAAGLDLEMPGPGAQRGAKLVDAVRSGDIEEALVDRALRRVLEIARRTGALEHPPGEERADDRPEHRALARRTASAGMVLLRNDGERLPLDPDRLSRLAVIGPNANVALIQGGGSAQVAAHYAVTPLEGVRKRCGDGIEVVFEPGCTIDKTVPAPRPGQLSSSQGPGLALEFFYNFRLEGDPVHVRSARDTRFFWFGEVAPGIDPREFSVRLSGTFTPDVSGLHDFGLVSAGKARLFLDEVEQIDNWTQQTRGDAFFGQGSREERCEITLEAGRSYALRIEFTKEGSFLGALRWGCAARLADDALERAVALAAGADAAVLVCGLNADWETEGNDRSDMELPGRQVELIERVAAANPNTVLVMNAGAPVRMDWLESVPAVLWCWYPGQEWGNALADVLFGDVNPSGRLPTTIPRRLEDTPAFLNYPGENGEVLYGEGVFVGYRYYDTVGCEPRLPFGHGLSYTRFAYGDAQVEPGDPAHVVLDLTNTGSRAGREVVQLYVHDVQSSVARPEQELAAFKCVALEPGETQSVRLPLTRRALSFYDPARSAWVAEPGEFELRVGASSRDIRSRARYTLDES